MTDTDDIGCRLYLITPSKIDPVVFRDCLAAALDAGDVAAHCNALVSAIRAV